MLRRSLSTYDILTVKDVVEAYESRGEFQSVFLTPLVYVLFFTFFASAALTHVPIETMFPSQNGLMAALVTSGSYDTLTADSKMKFKNIQSQADVFPWFIDTFVPSVFVTTDYNNVSIPVDQVGRIAAFQKVVGAVEIKAYVAPKIPCDVSASLSPIYKSCHDWANAEQETPWYLNPKSPAQEIIDWFQEVKANHTLVSDANTALHINVATYNGELNLLCITALQIKFQPGGYVDTRSKMTSMPLDPYGNDPSGGLMDLITGMFFLTTVGMDYRKIARHRKQKKAVVWTKWRMVTWMSLASVLTFYVFWIILSVLVTQAQLKNEIIAMENPAFDFEHNTALAIVYFIDIMDRMKTMGTIMIILRLSAMAAMCLLMFRILGSLRFHPGLNVVMATLTKSLRSLAPFFFVFVVCLSAFVMSGCLLFGDSTKAFSTIGMSYVTVVNMLFGQFNPDMVLDVNYYTAVVWYWSAMVVLSLVLFNMLLAIVIESFQKVHNSSDKRTAPYMAAISELLRVEGLWLWPWSRRDMIRLGRAVHADELRDVSAAAIAKHLALSDDQARLVLANLDCVVIEMGTAELTIDDVRLAYASRGDFVMIFLSPLFNMFFFLVFAACALDHTPIQSMFPSENGLANIVAKAGTDAVTTVTTTKFSNMATHHDVFPWLTNTFVPYTFVTTDYNGRNLSTPDLRRVNYVHRILGAVEFKTYSAPPRPCDVVDGPLGAMYAQCHDFDSPVLNSAFYIDAGADPETATAVISAKQASGAWLDASTANLHINLATFNGELNLLCLISLRVTFQPGGLDPYGTSYLAAPLDACVLVLWITTIWMELREWCRDHRRRTGQPPKPRFCTLWRAVTWLSVVSVAVYFAIWTALCVAVYSPTFAADLTALETGASSSQPQLLLVDIMTRLKAMGYLTLSVRIAGMVSLGLLMFRTLSSLRFHPHLNMVT
ncbi:hypothetical protein DYB34_012407, partial [Aphanomyces astaci]